MILATDSVASCGSSTTDPTKDPARVAAGQQTFRYETFGDETKWTDTLQMQTVISTAVDPTTALSVGLKVDATALPAAVVQGIQDGSVSLTSPATTIALLKLDAVVGIKGTVTTAADGTDTLTRVGITCALCHSTVDNSFAPGIGARLDGGPTSTSTPARSSRCRRRSPPTRRRSSTRGVPASTTPATTSTGKTAPRSFRPPTA